MNIPEHIKGGRELVPGQFFDLTLPIGRPGRVTAVASARRRSLTLAASAHYRVELFGPGASQPIASREIDGPGLLAILEHEAKSGAGLWTARFVDHVPGEEKGCRHDASSANCFFGALVPSAGPVPDPSHLPAVQLTRPPAHSCTAVARTDASRHRLVTEY